MMGLNICLSFVWAVEPEQAHCELCSTALT